MVHDDGAFLVIDLGVDARVADQVDDPLLAFRLREAEAGREVSVFQHEENVSFGVILEGIGVGHGGKRREGKGREGRKWKKGKRRRTLTYLISIRW